MVEDKTARGVILSDGTVVRADYVISAADGYTTIYKMLEGKYLSKEIIFAYSNWELFPPLVQVSFGIGMEIKSESPIILNFGPDSVIGSTKLEFGYSVMNYAYDDTMAPLGKTTIVMRYETRWNLWDNLDSIGYRREKEQIKKDATSCLEKIYPGISAHIEVVDVATPTTDARYTGVKEGAYEGFLPSKENMMKSLKMQLPKLKNFYMAGQWLFPGGGLPPSAQSGKWAVQLICRKKGQRFIKQP
jgi:phytoene dehydrogenase-like protein